MIFIRCKQAVDFVSKREESKLSGVQHVQLQFHLLICKWCRRFAQQNNYIVQAMDQYKEKETAVLTEGEKDVMVRRMQEEQGG